VQRREEAPIRLEDLVCTTLATLRIDESVATRKRLAVDAIAFLDDAQRTLTANSSLKQ
jgi:hypothetical protein